MSDIQVDHQAHSRIADAARAVLEGIGLGGEQALELFALQAPADIYDLMAWANRIREHYHGNHIHLCSVVNVKAGGCSEDCRFCAQSAFYQTSAPRHGFIESAPILQAAGEAGRNRVTGLGIVAAWKGLGEGPLLDEVCHRLRELSQGGQVRADASLGMIKDQKVADRLREAGCECYNHNLETSRRFFPQVCTTHAYEERIQTLDYLRRAGIKICCGGIIGMGETLQDRCDLAFSLQEQNPDLAPLNFLNPIPGTPFENAPPLTPLEILKTIACFRFILPRQHIMIAGGRVVNLRDIQSMVFMAGASALMVGNYLTTVNQPVEKDLQMLKDLKLEPLGYSSTSAGSPASPREPGL